MFFCQRAQHVNQTCNQPGLENRKNKQKSLRAIHILLHARKVCQQLQDRGGGTPQQTAMAVTKWREGEEGRVPRLVQRRAYLSDGSVT